MSEKELTRYVDVQTRISVNQLLTALEKMVERMTSGECSEWMAERLEGCAEDVRAKVRE